MTARAAYNRRPAPDEPWRYACPDCGSVGVERLIGGKRPRGATYTFGGQGPAQARADLGKHFRCPECCERKARVLDRKRDVEVRTV